MKRAYRGTARGEGAVYEWEGNRNIGKGRMEIASGAPPPAVRRFLERRRAELRGR